MRLMNWLRERLGAGQAALRGHRERRAASRPAPSFRPRLEVLEDRCVPSTLTVTNSSADPNVAHSLPYEVRQAQSGDTILITPAAEQNGPIVLNQTLVVARSVTIESANKNKPATISGGGKTQVFDVLNGVNVTLEGLNITDGFSYAGGGIYNSGTLSLVNSSVDNNTAFSNGFRFLPSEGGGIYNATGATLTVSNSHVDNNTAQGIFVRAYAAGGIGGGIYNAGTLTVNDNSTVDNNTAQGGGGFYIQSGGVGGGIENYTGATLTISDSHVDNNTAAEGIRGYRTSFGGGIFNAGTLTVNENSTVSGNQAIFGDGGGIYLYYFTTATVTDSTLSNDAARQGGAIFEAFGSTLTGTATDTFIEDTPNAIYP